MAGDTGQKEKKAAGLVLKDLYVFSLPPEISSTLNVASATDAQSIPSTLTTPSTSKSQDASEPLDTIPEAPEPGSGPLTHSGSSKATSCHTCSASFGSLDEQRAHAKSDWHRYNLKLKIQSRKPVSEEYFDKMIGELDESISGSGSDDSDGASGTDEEDRQDSLEALMRRQASISGPISLEQDHNDSSASGLLTVGHAPMVWFQSPAIPDPDIYLGVYKALFEPEELQNPTLIADSIRRLQQRPYNGPSVKKGELVTTAPPDVGPTYFLCMLGGGHFSAMLVGLSPRINRNPKTGHVEYVPVIIAHKSFHRYTTRRKQGGSQASSDAAKGAAHSAGSSLRRHNEAALTAEIRDLMVSWRGLITGASRLFIRIGRTKWTNLFGEDSDPIIRRNDPRIRRFPFTTRRATQTELLRAFSVLTKVEVSRVDVESMEREKAKEKESFNSAARKGQISASKATTSSTPTSGLSLEEQELILHTNQLTTLIKRSKAPAVLSYLQSNNLDPNVFRLTASTDLNSLHANPNLHTPTLLHLAAFLESGAVVIALITRAKADPTVPNADGKVPFQLCKETYTQDAFRISRHELGESAWDWAKAQVPTAVSKREIEEVKRIEEEKMRKEEEKAKKEKEERAKVEAIEAEARRKEKDEALRRLRFGKGIPLGRNVKTDAETFEESTRGLTPEMRRKLEREQRVKAIQARMKQQQS